MDTELTTKTPDLIEALGLADPATLADLDMLARVACLVTGATQAFVSFAEADEIWSASAKTARGSRQPLETAYCSALLAGEDDNFVSRNVLTDPRTRSVTRMSDAPQVVAYAGALLRAEDGRKLGTLCVTDSVERDFDASKIELLNGLAGQVMNLVSLRAAKRELTDALEAMTDLARTDALTGLINRRAWHEDAEALRKLVMRQSGTLTLVTLDLDHFKRINDSMGHAAGDAVLCEIGKLLKNELRATDLIGRIGGEEFAIAMPFTTLQAAAERMERLRLCIARTSILHDAKMIAVTISGGMADLRCTDTGLEGVMRRADQALYLAKAAGRNRIQQHVAESLTVAKPSAPRGRKALQVT